MLKKIFYKTPFIALLMIITSCATIVSGSRQYVGFSSRPSNAQVYVDGQMLGNTPLLTNLERKQNHRVSIELAGYLPFETILTRKFNGWYVGNIVFGGVIGLIVDPITGAIYNLTPKKINASLSEDTRAFNQDKKSDLYIEVTLVEDDSNLQKIGQLQKLVE